MQSEYITRSDLEINSESQSKSLKLETHLIQSHISKNKLSDNFGFLNLKNTDEMYIFTISAFCISENSSELIKMKVGNSSEQMKIKIEKIDRVKVKISSDLKKISIDQVNYVYAGNTTGNINVQDNTIDIDNDNFIKYLNFYTKFRNYHGFFRDSNNAQQTEVNTLGQVVYSRNPVLYHRKTELMPTISKKTSFVVDTLHQNDFDTPIFFTKLSNQSVNRKIIQLQESIESKPSTQVKHSVSLQNRVELLSTKDEFNDSNFIYSLADFNKFSLDYLRHKGNVCNLHDYAVPLKKIITQINKNKVCEISIRSNNDYEIKIIFSLLETKYNKYYLTINVGYESMYHFGKITSVKIVRNNLILKQNYKTTKINLSGNFSTVLEKMKNVFKTLDIKIKIISFSAESLDDQLIKYLVTKEAFKLGINIEKFNKDINTLIKNQNKKNIGKVDFTIKIKSIDQNENQAEIAEPVQNVNPIDQNENQVEIAEPVQNVNPIDQNEDQAEIPGPLPDLNHMGENRENNDNKINLINLFNALLSKNEEEMRDNSDNDHHQENHIEPASNLNHMGENHENNDHH